MNWWLRKNPRPGPSLKLDGQEHGDDPAWDAAEAAALYDLLEGQVIHEFYDRSKQGIPTAWVNNSCLNLWNYESSGCLRCKTT